MGLAEGAEGLEHFLDFAGGGAAETAGQVGGVTGGLGERGTQREVLLGGAFGPGGEGFLAGFGDVEAGLGGGAGFGGGLEFGAEPADEAGVFLGAAFGVQGDKAGDDFGGGEVGSPAVGGGDFAIERVVQGAQD